ncbi:hypothetical protein yfred0001_18540 [Yersinia frederiksenii ATCC 33641]|nr:hypothetical protein yfred0001_18540 [Yersinia frederiksenii ATCC 33641]
MRQAAEGGTVKKPDDYAKSTLSDENTGECLPTAWIISRQYRKTGAEDRDKRVIQRP